MTSPGAPLTLPALAPWLAPPSLNAADPRVAGATAERGEAAVGEPAARAASDEDGSRTDGPAAGAAADEDEDVTHEDGAAADHVTREDGAAADADAEGEREGVVVVGASAGGLEALRKFLPGFAEEFPWPVVVLEHRAPHADGQFERLLQKECRLPVRGVEDGKPVEPGVVHVASGGTIVKLTKERTFHVASAMRGAPTVVDKLFTSAADAYGDCAIAVVLSGTGSDGAAGALDVRKAGGTVLAESEETAGQAGMPGAAARLGVVDFMRPVDELAGLVRDFVAGTLKPPAREDPGAFQGILSLLKARRGTDCAAYRAPTLRRRLHKRVVARGVKSLSEYKALLESEPEELDELFDTLLINVTEFFRDPEAWRVLDERVLPTLAEQYRNGGEIRLWSAGCASGEEAYSVAILLAEHLGSDLDPARVKVFATDVDADAVDTARQARYDEALLGNVSDERKQKYFTRHGSTFELAKRIRRLVVFGVHDLTNDPPIGRIDLVLCRNVLIYFDVELQRRTLGLLRYALRSDGHLFLGRSEALGQEAGHFRPVDRGCRVFRKTGGASLGATDRATPLERANVPRVGPPAATREAAGDLAEAVADVISDGAHVAALVVDDDFTIRYWNRFARVLLGGGTGGSKSPVNLEDLTALAPSGIVDEVRRVFLRGERAHVSAVDVASHGRRMALDFDLQPFPIPGAGTGVLVAALDVTAREVARDALKERTTTLQETIEELQSTNEELQSANEELETANEELQASNEELATLNEEQQSTNEEMEATNEELSSTNEELQAVNSELERRSDELREITGVLGSIVEVAQGAIIVCDSEGTVQRANEAARAFVGDREHGLVGRNLFALDAGLPVEDVRDALRDAKGAEDARANRVVPGTDATRTPVQLDLAVLEARDETGAPVAYLVTWRNVTHEERAQRALERGEREGVLVVTLDGDVVEATAGARHLLGIPDDGALPSKLWAFTSDPAEALQVRGALSETVAKRRDGDRSLGPTVTLALAEGARVHATFHPLAESVGHPLVVLTATRDVPPSDEGS